jgi:hypothetical protein
VRGSHTLHIKPVFCLSLKLTAFKRRFHKPLVDQKG